MWTEHVATGGQTSADPLIAVEPQSTEQQAELTAVQGEAVDLDQNPTDDAVALSEASTDRMRGVRRDVAAEAEPSTAVTGVVRADRQTAKVFKPGPLGKPQWHPIGQRIQVGGHVLRGGVYVGRKLRAPSGAIEPALIDPTLKVATKRLDVSGDTMGYWPSYHEIRPEARGAYLSWLAQGRRNSNVSIGYVFLFMYGLERRVLIDVAGAIAEDDGTLRAELLEIKGEMLDLLALHDNGSFHSYGVGFLDVIDLMLLQGDGPLPIDVPPMSEQRWDLPLALKVQLGSFAADRQPVPADWALAWAWFHPDSRIRTAAVRCTEEFATLFKSEYRRAFGDGLIPQPGRTKIHLHYLPATSGIAEVDVSMPAVTDVAATSAHSAQLVAITDRVQDALDPYSRFIGKRPGEWESLRAVALLPRELLTTDTPVLAPFLQALHEALKTGGGIAHGKTVVKIWAGAGETKLSKQDSVVLCQLAEKLGYGIEPDPRFGGPPITAESTVGIFPLPNDPPHTPSPEYSTATTLAHLALAVSAADGDISGTEATALFNHIESWLKLTPAEAVRLEAHASWITTSAIKVTGLTKRVASLSRAQQEGLGKLLIDIAVSDGVISPEEVTTITKLFKLLGLDPSAVTGRLHEALTSVTGPSNHPTLVRTADPAEPGIAVPPPPEGSPETDPASAAFALDAASIEQKRRETASVSELLMDIFDENEKSLALPGRRSAERPEADETTESSSDVEVVAGLDASLSTLVMQLSQATEIDREKFDALCEALALLPNGALDTLNDAALDACDDLLLEGDELITINRYALEEMVR